MDFYGDIKSILDGAAAEVVFLRPSGFSDMPCISYYTQSETGGFYCDNEEDITDYVFVLDVWAKDAEECMKTAKKADKLMRENGYYKQVISDEEKAEDGLYHKKMKYTIQVT